MSRKKLLLVEDDRALAELLIWHFEREDFEVAAPATAKRLCCSLLRTLPTSSSSTG